MPYVHAGETGLSPTNTRLFQEANVPTAIKGGQITVLKATMVEPRDALLLLLREDKYSDGPLRPEHDFVPTRTLTNYVLCGNYDSDPMPYSACALKVLVEVDVLMCCGHAYDNKHYRIDLIADKLVATVEEIDAYNARNVRDSDDEMLKCNLFGDEGGY